MKSLIAIVFLVVISSCKQEKSRFTNEYFLIEKEFVKLLNEERRDLIAEELNSKLKFCSIEQKVKNGYYKKVHIDWYSSRRPADRLITYISSINPEIEYAFTIDENFTIKVSCEHVLFNSRLIDYKAKSTLQGDLNYVFNKMHFKKVDEARKLLTFLFGAPVQNIEEFEFDLERTIFNTKESEITEKDVCCINDIERFEAEFLENSNDGTIEYYKDRSVGILKIKYKFKNSLEIEIDHVLRNCYYRD